MISLGIPGNGYFLTKSSFVSRGPELIPLLSFIIGLALSFRVSVKDPQRDLAHFPYLADNQIQIILPIRSEIDYYFPLHDQI